MAGPTVHTYVLLVLFSTGKHPFNERTRLYEDPSALLILAALAFTTKRRPHGHTTQKQVSIPDNTSVKCPTPKVRSTADRQLGTKTTAHQRRTCIDAYPIPVQPYLSTYITLSAFASTLLYAALVTRTGEFFDTRRRNITYLSRTKRCINTMPETPLFGYNQKFII